jgi:hypothetical protein
LIPDLIIDLTIYLNPDLIYDLNPDFIHDLIIDLIIRLDYILES